MTNFSKLQTGDVLVCKSGNNPNEFSLFAEVIENDTMNNRIKFNRYMRFGKVFSSTVTWTYDELRRYYEKASSKEKELFHPRRLFV